MLEYIATMMSLLLIPFLHLLARNVLYNKKALKVLIVIALFLCVIAIIISLSYAKKGPHFYYFLFCPIYDLILLDISLKIFRKIKKRDPEDAPRQLFPYDDGLWSDRFYDLILYIMWVMVPFVIVTYSYWD